MRRSVVRRSAVVTLAVVLAAGALVGCRQPPPMIQPVAPVPTISQG